MCAFSSIFLCSFYLFSLCIGFSVFRWQSENRANMNHFTQSLPFNLDIVYGFDCSSSQIHALKVCMHRLHPIRMNLFIHTGGGARAPAWAGVVEKVDPHCCWEIDWIVPALNQLCFSRKVIVGGLLM